MRFFRNTPIAESLRWQNVGTFLFFSLAFAIPSGYSYGAVLLLVGAALSFRWADLNQLRFSAFLLLFAFLSYSVVWGIDGVLRGEGVRELDRPLRFLLAGLVFVPLRLRPPSLVSVAAGIGLGGLSAGFVACYDLVFNGLTRPHGFMPVNSFGMIAAIYTGFCVLLLQEFRAFRMSARLGVLLGLGAFSALGAVLLSGSRGAYIVLLLIGLIVVYRDIKRYRLRSVRVAIVSASISLCLGLFFTIDSPLKQRVVTAYTSTTAYISTGERIGDSIPSRLDMWTNGIDLFLEKPFFGWGETGYRATLGSRIGQDKLVVEASNRHLHNQFVHVLVTKGLLGLFLLGLLLYAPLVGLRRPFAAATIRADRVPSEPSSAVGALLLMIVLAYVVGGLSRTPFEHHSGVMVFSFSVVILLALAERRPADKAVAWRERGRRLTRPV